jgi:hypothetical protein
MITPTANPFTGAVGLEQRGRPVPADELHGDSARTSEARVCATFRRKCITQHPADRGGLQCRRAVIGNAFVRDTN